MVAAGLVAVFVAMMGAAYAAVPLYKLICAATGINGTTQRVTSNPGKALARTMTIHFDANTGGSMPWHFKPDVEQMTVHVGETTIAYFSAVNPTDHVISGSATYNITPEIAGKYFDKIQCFCFTRQTLKAGERAEMPVIFYVDPAIMNEASANDIKDLTLSYTFFETHAPAAPNAAASTVNPVKIKAS